MAFQVFVSYASRDDLDGGIVTALVAALDLHLRERTPHASIWRDEHKIRPSDHFDRAIEDGLKASDVLLIVLSDNWLASDYCRRELEMFASKTRAGSDERNSPVIVAALHEVPFDKRPPLLARQVGYKCFDPSPEAIEANARSIAEDVQQRFIAKRAAAAANLPLLKTPLVGRAGDVFAILEFFDLHQLVTIAGPGGVGKTRVGLQCAAETAGLHEHGEVFVNLAPIGEAGLIAPTILGAMGVGGDGDAAYLIDLLRSRRMLLVLDNCEHLRAGVASLASQIIGGCPGVIVLATSREALHVDGEQIYRLQPLETAQAVQLFAERARAVAPAFDPSASIETVRKICERLDGIPLAIELAAARMRALRAGDILRLLDERFRLLTGGSRDALPRQQTLAALIAWSYDLLDEQERSLFRRLSVFRGTFSLRAAASVCAADGACDEFTVLDALTSLADKSLLTIGGEGETRYGMLETIREFAVQKAAEGGESADVANQHARFFESVAAQAYREFDTHLPEGWLDRLRPDIDNLRAALSWTLEAGGDRAGGAQLAADCGPIFLRLYFTIEGLRWTNAGLIAANAHPGVEGRLYYNASMLQNNMGQYAAALQSAERAFERVDSLDSRTRLRVFSQVAQLNAHAENYARARSIARETIAAAERMDDPELCSTVLRRCAYALPVEDIAYARELFERALSLARACEDGEQAAMVLEWWAHREDAAGNTRRAIELATQALDSISSGSHISIEISIAGWALGLGDLDKAEVHVRRAVPLAADVEVPLARAMATLYALPFVANADLDAARSLLNYCVIRLAELDWDVEHHESATVAQISRILAAEPRADGAARRAWTDESALSWVARVLNNAAEKPFAAGRS